jgi:hypothetical protein
MEMALCGGVCKLWNAASNNRRLWRFFAISEYHVIAAGPNIDWKQLYIARVQGKTTAKASETATTVEEEPTSYTLKEADRPKLGTEVEEHVKKLALLAEKRNNYKRTSSLPVRGMRALKLVRIVAAWKALQLDFLTLSMFR